MEENIKKSTSYFLIGISIVFFIILLRAVQLQIIDHEYYEMLAQDNFWKNEIVLPKRGTIYDRNGIVLAQDIPSYQLLICLSDLFYDMDISNDRKHIKNPQAYPARKEPEEIKYTIDMESPYMESFKKLYALLRENNYKVEYSQKIELENSNGIKEPITEYTLDLITEEYLLEKLEKVFDKKVKQVATKLDDIAKKYKKGSKKYKKEKRNIEYDYYRRPEKFLDNIPANIALKILAKEKIFDWEKLENIEENIKKKQSLTHNEYKGFVIQRSFIREYPQGECAAQLIGTLRKPTEQEIKESKDEIDFKGSFGLEGLFDSSLQGNSGTQEIGRDGTQRPSFEEDGHNIYTTIDIKLQKIAEETLDEQRNKSYDAFQRTKTSSKISGGPAIGGAAVLIHIPTGEIRVMASSPRYDNNRLKKIYDSLKYNESHPLLNRCIQYHNAIPPGSTFKVATASYGLAHNIISPYTQFDCRGALEFYPDGRKKSFRCTHHHGTLDVEEAIAGSCNIFFYKVGEMMSFDQLYDCASDFGFGEKSGLELAGENEGEIPRKDPEWERGQRRFMGMGQLWATTPIQVARLMYIVATNGIYPNLTLKAYEDDPIQVKLKEEEQYQSGQLGEKPKTHEEIVAYINKEKSNQITCMQKRLNYSSNVWRYIHQGMRGVLVWNEGTNDRRGSAYSLGRRLDPTVKIAAKTGTAQVTKYRDAYGNLQKYDKQKIATGEIKAVNIDHAWFAGYAPYENPEYAFAILIELGGSGGTYAGPVIEKILKAIYGTEAKM